MLIVTQVTEVTDNALITRKIKISCKTPVTQVTPVTPVTILKLNPESTFKSTYLFLQLFKPLWGYPSTLPC